MKKKALLTLILFSMVFASCNMREVEISLSLLKRIVGSLEEQQEGWQEEMLTSEERQRQMDLRWAVATNDVDKVKQYMEEGYDPNRSRDEEGWISGTPLNIIARFFTNTYIEFRLGGMTDPPSDVEMLQLLVEAGADVNRRPYIWCTVHTWDNRHLDSITERESFWYNGQRPFGETEMKRLEDEKAMELSYFLKDANRMIEAFLKAGADPDKLGHPYPYSLAAKRKGITDKEADEYFAKGTRPINEAIKKGMRWESQVDLLLQYTTLDEDSLKAARESKDRAMIKKIKELWNEQNGKEPHSLPLWMLVAISGGTVVLAGGVVFIVRRRKRR
jgi:hypothetical protein